MKRRIFLFLDIIGAIIDRIVTRNCANCEGSGTVAIGNEHALCPVCGGLRRL